MRTEALQLYFSQSHMLAIKKTEVLGQVKYS